jgi:hypothetical protein
VDGGWKKKHLGGFGMLESQAVYEIAKKYQAEVTAGRQIQWHVTENSHGGWMQITRYPPSVMDSLILEKAWRQPGYLAAAKAATGWSNSVVWGFHQTMYLGHPLESEQMYLEDFMYWKGVVIALMVIQKLKYRLREAESHFS